MSSITFLEFSEFCDELEKISSTIELSSKIANFLRNIESDDDIYNIALFLTGRIYPPWDEREVGIGVGLVYEALRLTTGLKKREIEEIVKETGDLGLASEKVLSRKLQTILFREELTIAYLREVFDAMSSLKGEKSQKKKVRMLMDLFSSASPIEAKYITRLLLGEMRLGVGEGILRDAIAKAFNLSADIVERAYMITNDFGKVAVTAKKEGEEGLKRLKIKPHIPIRMMLAQVAESVESAVMEMGRVAVEWKFDGTRVQIHYADGRITIYSRRLENVTKALPDVVEMVKKSVKSGVILDGEAIAIKDGKPLPFQNILRRFRRKHRISQAVEKIPITVQVFDILYCDNEIYSGETIDLPLHERRKILENVVKDDGNGLKLARQEITSDVRRVHEIFDEAIAAGHEGVMLKRPDSLYIPGKRGKNWLKIKEVMETLDLVVVAGEWGEGKRSHFISSFELACVAENGDLLPVGKVATGFTEDDLEELTELFKNEIEYEEGKKVVFKPKYVFEVAYQEIQKSPKYESGYALRFPRFVRLREDKDISEADTIERVGRLYESQFGMKGAR
ncbi:DNA ligase I, ATP-dependent (dnl1) [Archaeoglobus sulfaticallidus PM70-1]|uniref:DNA ligase n=1 Tax=Archaeoglobus sulfaticallidus PM70-1 TaxID=387631 RepID=N0BM06_9EURY|nr:ATP-dependent DNA ligase [Archaeoglobus sulfaticallidus]AGK61611.1 DNA ligase I, ATP-dependent (dnl1) [Archaeoglobus sulfaticallidus PM70-1]